MKTSNLPASDRKPRGQPSVIGVNADRICEMIGEGYTLRQIGREIGCTSGAISLWAIRDEEFGKRYALAREVRADRFADEILEIADDGTNDWQRRELEDGTILEVPDHEHINRSRLRVDTRKWLMARMAPKKYGDRVTTEITGPDGGPLEVKVQRIESRIIDAEFADITADVQAAPGRNVASGDAKGLPAVIEEGEV